jgi:hypothetical protein
MTTIKFSTSLLTIHLFNLVGGFFFASNEQQQPQPRQQQQQLHSQQPLSSSTEIIDAFVGGFTTMTMSSSVKSEQHVLEQRLADVRFPFN